jgi:UDP-N-acetylmuramate dehydrogenase
MSDIAKALAARLGERVERKVSAATLTTYRCGGPLAIVVRVDSEKTLTIVAEVLADHGDVDVLTIGRGSNLLVADAGFEGVALVLGGDLDRLQIDEASAIIEVGAPVALPVLARRTAAEGVGGLEFFVGIPGSVGGAVRMNAGGHGAETKDVIIDARVFDLASGSSRTLAADVLDFGYRRSAIGARQVVTGARFQGVADDPAACGTRVDEIVAWRREHQPGGQNAGSVFTNPPGDAAGRLIEAAGLKGLRVGSASVSEKHANFFVADPGAHADDVYALIDEVRTRVDAAMGVELEPELQFVGFAGKSKR